jgi:ADP-L-glycero-D-manno-heptose 6-epimerase
MEEGQQETRVCRFVDPDVLAEVRSGRYEAVLHQAAICDTMAADWNRLESVNIRDVLLLADACKAGNALLVYASSHSVYGTIYRPLSVPETADRDPDCCSGPLNLYAKSKLALDHAMMTRHSSTRWIGLRYTNVFGPGEAHKGAMASILWQLLQRAATGARIHLFDDTLHASRDYVPVEHLAVVVARLIDRAIPSGIYNLGSGLPIRFSTLLEWCADFSNSNDLEVEFVPNPLPHRYQYWTCADVSKLAAFAQDVRVLRYSEIQSAAYRLYRRFRLGTE